MNKYFLKHIKKNESILKVSQFGVESITGENTI